MGEKGREVGETGREVGGMGEGTGNVVPPCPPPHFCIKHSHVTHIKYVFCHLVVYRRYFLVYLY